MLVFSALSLLAQDAIRYISYSDGRVYAFPKKYILNETEESGVVTLTLEGDATFTYNVNEVTVSEEFNSTINPTLTSYGFTNEDNDQVYSDIDAIITEEGDRIVVNANVPVIGKRLRPSFELSEGFSMWLGAEKQESGVTSHRFTEPFVFTLAPDNHLMYSEIKENVSQDEWIYTKIDPSTAFTNAPSNGFDGKVLNNLWDENPATIFHSTWGDGPYTQLNWVNNGYWGDGVTEWPYIQIELPENVDNFCFEYTTPDYAERVPYGWHISAKVKNSEEWETIATLNNNLPTQIYTPYKSEVYTLEKEYSAVRLELTNAPYKNYLVLSDLAFYTRKKNDTQMPKEMGFVPFGRECEVNVKYLTDYATGQYKIPTVYITFGEDTTRWDYDQWIGMYTFDEDGNNVWTKEEWITGCTFQLDGAGVWPDIAKVEGCEVRGRGNSSWSQDYMSKNPFRIKFPKKQKQSPFNLTEDRQWVFIANKQSGSMTSNSIAQKVAAMVDAEALCHMIPVDVYINGHYRGSYCFTEKIGIADNSVAIDESTGCLLELDDYYDETYKFRDNNYYLPVNVKDPDFSEEEDERVVTFDGIMKSFNEMTFTLQSGGDITKYIDMESWAKFWLVNDLVRNAETHHPKSCYIFNENPADGEKWKFGPVWDFDWAFGYEETKTYFIHGADEDLFSGVYYQNKAGYNFYDALRNSNAGKVAYYKEWRDFMEEGRLQELLEYIDDYTAFAKLSFEHNNYAYIWETDYSDYDMLAERSKGWIERRANYIYNEIKNLQFIDDVSNVVLTDGEDFSHDVAQEVDKLTYNRTLPNMLWNPLYVPFKIPVASISDKYDVAYINGMHSYDRNDDGTIDDLTMEVIKIANGTLKSNYPYLIKAKSEADMEMTIEQEGTVLYPSESTTLSCSSVYTRFDITGTYNEMTAEELDGSLVITSNGSWGQMDPDYTLKPYRLYLTITNSGDSPVEIDQEAMSRISISVLGEETGIFETENAKVKTENYYDLTGRRVQKAQKGIFVVNGKKVVK